MEEIEITTPKQRQKERERYRMRKRLNPNFNKEKYQEKKLRGYYKKNKDNINDGQRKRYRLVNSPDDKTIKYSKGTKCPQRLNKNPHSDFGRLNKDPEFIKKRLKGLIKRPNKLETQLIQLINQNNLPYKYVGDGSFILGNKNPDFINYNGKKQVIELFGQYWHTEPMISQPIQERIDLFKSYGFECLIIWDYELDNPVKVIRRIKNFDTLGITN